MPTKPRTSKYFGDMDIWDMMETIRSKPESISPEAINHVDENGMTPLLRAIEGNKPDLVTWLLDHGASVNTEIPPLVVLARTSVSQRNQTETMTGIKERLVQVINDVSQIEYEQEHAIKLLIASLLISRGAQVYFPRDSPLEYALMNRDAKLANMLLDNGAWKAKPHPRAYTRLILDASALKDLSVLRRMLADYTSLLKTYSPLSSMMNGGYSAEAVEMLIEAGSPIKSDYGIKAVAGCNSSVLEVLLKHGLNPNTLDKHQNSLLILSVIQGCTNVQEKLLKYGADVNFANRDGKTALHFQTYPSQVKELLKAGANINLEDNFGQTPIFALGHELNQSKPWKTEKVSSYHTPTTRVKTETDVLIAHGANINHQDYRKRTPMIWAAMNGDNGAVYRLSKAGADHYRRDDNGLNALFYAVMLKNKALAKFLIPREEINLSDINGDTPLMWAVENQMTDIVKDLISSGVDVNAMDEEGHTALMRAVDQDDPKTIRMLVKAGALINARDKTGTTAIVWAVRLNRKSSFGQLVKLGADSLIKDNTGKNAMSWAKLKKRTDMIDILYL